MTIRACTCAVVVLTLVSIPFPLRAETTSLQSQIDAYNQQLVTLTAKIAQYEAQLKTIGEEKSTLQAAINALTLTQQKLTTQIQVTENKISSTNLQIEQLTASIHDKEETIGQNREAIAKMLRTMSQADDPPVVASVLAAQTLTDAWTRVDEAIQFTSALTQDITALRAAQTALTTNRDKVAVTKATLVSLQKDLSTQKRSVLASRAQQQELLKQTKNQESNYQKLLTVAKAELASFSTFTQNAGGSKLLPNQTSCDDWGCYYSQRDTLWGNIPLNKTRFRLASDGCLVTAMAMVLTHYGHRDVTPVTINADPSNFASYYPAYLLFTIRVDGATAIRKASVIDATLAKGDPVVVGVHAYGGTHYVVLTSGSRGNYLMRDPYVANGKDIPFTKHYSVGSIFGISKVIVEG